MRHETGPQICSFCHAVSAFAVLKKVSCGRIDVSSDIFSESSVLRIMEFSSRKCHYSGAPAGAEGARGRSSIPIENGKSIKPRKFGGRPRTYVRTD